MPYIKPLDRPTVEKFGANTAGELNYLITKHLCDYVDSVGESYKLYNKILTAFECVTTEYICKYILHNAAVGKESYEDFGIFVIVKEYLEVHNYSSDTIMDVPGALSGAKLELYRRKIACYEDEKIIENGDVY